jgi:hypothetical protein
MIKYRFALDRFDNLIDVDELERLNLTKDDKFFSVDFKQELIPRLGKIKVKHFAHKSGVDSSGNSETYLHALGKKIFFDEYNQCLINKTPFCLDYNVNKVCNRLESKYNTTCEYDCEKKLFDLTNYFTEIYVEKRDGEFIPDILLLNPKTLEKIYIEIAVTHESTEEKINSGIRIIEFYINSEEDAEELRNFKFDSESVFYNKYNFKEKTIVQKFCNAGDCSKKVALFTVSKSGKCHLNIANERALDSLIEKYKETTEWQTIEVQNYSEEDDYYSNNNAVTYLNFIAKAFEANVKIKNCFICRYHANNNSYERERGQSIFCKFLKKTCGSNDASDCKYFKADILHVENIKGNNYFEE